MIIYTYPKDRIFYEKLKWISSKIGDFQVCRLTHLSLHKKLIDLSEESNSNLIEDEAAIIQLTESIVIFKEVEQNHIGKFILAFKKNKIWPICSVITKNSEQMSVAILIEHLSQDRMSENRIKARLSK